MFLGHHGNVDRVESYSMPAVLLLCCTRSLASHTQVLSEPCGMVTHHTALQLELPEALSWFSFRLAKELLPMSI